MSEPLFSQALIRIEGPIAVPLDGFEKPMVGQDVHIREIDIAPCGLAEGLGKVIQHLHGIEECILQAAQGKSCRTVLHLQVSTEDEEYLLLSLPHPFLACLVELDMELELAHY